MRIIDFKSRTNSVCSFEQRYIYKSKENVKERSEKEDLKLIGRFEIESWI